jgi:ribonuclease HII
MLKRTYLEKVYEAGCDEAGRGSLAGPVVAAAVILPSGYSNPMLNDSKKLPAAIREQLREEIENEALAWAVGQADNREIDNMNILQASILAMHRALSQLSPRPRHIIVDGNHFRQFEIIPHTCFVRGDSLYLNIAAASVLAKVHRDMIMMNLHEDYPVYGWAGNKGYATPFHVNALRSNGSSPFHRNSFKIKPRQLSIRF